MPVYVCCLSPKPAMENMDVFYSKKKMVKETVSAALSAKAMVLALFISLVGSGLPSYICTANFDSFFITKLMLKCFIDWPSPTTLCPTPWAGQQVASSIFQWHFILLI